MLCRKALKIEPVNSNRIAPAEHLKFVFGGLFLADEECCRFGPPKFY